MVVHFKQSKRCYFSTNIKFCSCKMVAIKWTHHTVIPIEGTFRYLAPEHFCIELRMRRGCFCTWDSPFRGHNWEETSGLILTKPASMGEAFAIIGIRLCYSFDNAITIVIFHFSWKMQSGVWDSISDQDVVNHITGGNFA
ncbi:unnamed protein product [Coffea canephora]|uniref:Uncharacterized protein n=1 Tax=Coffea canephora TaxID=49390 RepID=A0A068U9G7_COFCA|nr:unnamed protein product [Coffea canephora]